jgi:hypothetical protein
MGPFWVTQLLYLGRGNLYIHLGGKVLRDEAHLLIGSKRVLNIALNRALKLEAVNVAVRPPACEW